MFIKESLIYILQLGPTAKFIYDSTIPTDMVYWDTLGLSKEITAIREKSATDAEFHAALATMVFVIYYNTPDHLQILNVNDSLDTLFEKYILGPTLNKGLDIKNNFLINDPNESKLGAKFFPKWLNFDFKRSLFMFRSDVFMTLNLNPDNIQLCSYLSEGLTGSVSEHYQFANLSKGRICSNKEMNARNPGPVTYCQFNLMESPYLHECSCYVADDKKLYDVYLQHKASMKSINISAVIHRSINNTYIAVIKNTTEDVIINQLKYTDIEPTQDRSILYKEVFLVLSTILDQYKDDYNIQTIYDFENLPEPVMVNVKLKKSYISNLMLGEADVLSKSDALQTV